MSHLATIFSTLGIQDSKKLLERCEAAFAPEPSFEIRKVTCETFAAVNVLKPFSYALEQPFYNGDDSLLLDGTLYDDRPFDELLQILFSGNPSRLKTLNGQFNAAIFRRGRNELTIVTDRLGYRPLYYAFKKQRHVISSTIKGIRAAIDCFIEISPIGLMELFAFGHNLADRTLLNGITVLPPGSVTTIGANGVRTVTYHEHRYSPAHVLASPREWGERISTCIKKVAPKYVRGPARNGIFLSGGLDSRLVAAALGSADKSVQAYTFGHPDSRDVRFAREIASRVGFSHETLNYPVNYLSKTIKDIVARTECAAPFYHATSIAFHDSIASATDHISVGFCGDVLSGGHLRRSMLRRSAVREVEQLVFRRALCTHIDDIARIFQPSFFDRYWPETVDAFNASISEIDEMLGADVADVWDMRNRQRRFTFSAQKVDRPRFEIVAPLLDNEFVDLMTRLPIAARWKQSAYRHAIIYGFPHLRDVPWTRTGRPVPSGRLESWFDEGRRISEKAYQLALSKAGFGGELSKDAYKSIAEDMRNDEWLFKGFLGQRLTDRSLPPEIFNLKSISALVEAHLNGEDFSHLLGTVMTVAVYLED